MKIKSFALKVAKYRRPSEKGFTIIELAIVVLVSGVLAAVVAPSWVAFQNRQKIRTGNGDVLRAMQSAQSFAKAKRETWQASFRTVQQNGEDIVQWAFHPATITDPGNDLPEGNSDKFSENTWSSLQKGVEIADSTNLVEPADDLYRVMFNYNGCVVYSANDRCTETDEAALPDDDRPPTLALIHVQLDSNAQRCVRVETLLGALRITEGDDCETQKDD